MPQERTKHLFNTERIPTVEAHYHLMTMMTMTIMMIMTMTIMGGMMMTQVTYP